MVSKIELRTLGKSDTGNPLVDSYKVEGKDPLMIRFLGERITYVGRTETERKPYQYRLTLRYVERTQQNPYGLVVGSVEQSEPLLEASGKGSDPRNR